MKRGSFLKRARPLRAATFVLVEALARSSSAAPLPSYAAPGFPLETLDPAPAGGNFLVTPEAALPANPVSVRAIWDFTWGPAAVQAQNGTASDNSVGAWNSYVHLGFAAAPIPAMLLSMNIPMVLRQNVSLLDPSQGLTGDVGTAPNLGDLGDMRFGARFGGKLVKNWDFGVATDLWITTGNAQSLTGDAASRLRVTYLLSGKYAWGLYLAGAIGYQEFLSPVAGSDGGAVPVRLGVAYGFRTGSVELRPALEYFGTPWAPATGNIHRDAGEGLASFFLDAGHWTIGISAGHAAFSDAPGVPAFRTLLAIQYGTRDVDRAVLHALQAQ